MQRFQRATFAGLACVAIGGQAASVPKQPAHLRADTASVEPWQAALQSSITHFAFPSSVSAVAQTKGVKVEKGDKLYKDVKGDKGDKGKKTDQPVQVQVPDNEMNKFMDTLSTGCKGRFKQMLDGKGADLHTFGSTAVAANKASCSKLDGKMCATSAHIIHEKKHTASGRKMESATDVSGDSCLPQECMTAMDLHQLATFMQTQAKTIIPGDDHRVELHVDCTMSGGPKDSVGGPPRSGSAAMVPTAVALALVLAITV